MSLVFFMEKLRKGREINYFTAFLGGPERDRTVDLSDANRTISHSVRLYAPKTDSEPHHKLSKNKKLGRNALYDLY